MASVATLILFNMVGLWNEWFTGMIYLKDMDWHPLQTFLQQKLNNPIDPTKMTREELELASKLSDRTLMGCTNFCVHGADYGGISICAEIFYDRNRIGFRERITEV